MKRVILISSVFILLATQDAVASPQKLRPHACGVEGQYIVLLRAAIKPDDVPNIVRDLARRYGVSVDVVWQYVRGFACSAKAKEAAALADDDRVEYVEQNALGVMPANVSSTQWTNYNGFYLWNLDRLDDLVWGPPAPGNPNGRDSQLNMCTEARDVIAYVIDYGIWHDHPEFETPSRVLDTFDFSADRGNYDVEFVRGDESNGCTVSRPPNLSPRAGATHATYVASVLAGTHIGASKASLVSLKTVTCNANVNPIVYINAVNFIADRNANPYYGRLAVINHSGFIPIWDSAQFTAYGDAVERIVTLTNIPFFTSANNYSGDACQFSPAYKAYTRTNRNGTVFTVGGSSVGASGTDPNDYRWQTRSGGFASIGIETGSNGGACVSIYAPAESIYVGATPPRNPSLYEYRAGTSFAAPAVAGIAARYLKSYTARTGLVPTYRMVYDYLLNLSQTPVVNASTPEYWMCAAGVNGDYTFPYVGRTPPSSCGPGQTLVHFNATYNPSDARMVYFDEGYCP